MSDCQKNIKHSTNDLLSTNDTKLIKVQQRERSYNKATFRCLARVFGTAMLTAALLVLSFVAPTAVKANAETTETTVTSADYYQSVEKANLEKQIDAITQYYGLCLDNYKNAKNGIGSEVTVKADIDPSIVSSMGLEGLNSVKAAIKSMQTDKKAKSEISLFTNEKEFTKLDVYVDINKELEYILIPELSKAYLKISMNPANGVSNQAPMPFTTKELMDLIYNNPLSEESLNKLLDKYTSILVEDLDDVSVINDNVTASGINEVATKAAVQITKKTQLDIAEKVLKTAKSDTELADLYVKFKLGTKQDYTNVINAALVQITEEKSKADTEDKVLVMNVWVNADGNIIARDFTYDTEPGTSFLGYVSAKKDSEIGFEAWYTPNNDEKYAMDGRLKEEGKAVTGDIHLAVNDGTSPVSDKFLIKLDNFSYTSDSYTSYMNGKFTITGNLLSGMSIAVDCTGKDKRQTMKMDFAQYEKNQVSVLIDSKIIDYKDFKLPDKSAKIYDMETQMEDYMASADIQKFLKGINKKIDVKGINAIIDQMLYPSMQMEQNQLDMKN